MAIQRSGRFDRVKKPLKSDMNVVPYIDVMLVLLVIFMITAPMITTGVKVDLPQASNQPMQLQERESPLAQPWTNNATNANVSALPSSAAPAQELGLGQKCDQHFDVAGHRIGGVSGDPSRFQPGLHRHQRGHGILGRGRSGNIAAQVLHGDDHCA